MVSGQWPERLNSRIETTHINLHQILFNLTVHHVTFAPMYKRNPPVQSYRELFAWQKAVDYVAEIYQCTKSFPETERFGLTSQLRRAAVSVPSNIAEGQGRATTGEFKQFLGHARGSLLEIETQLEIATRLGFTQRDETERLRERSAGIGRMLNGLMNSLDKRLKSA